MNGNFYEIRSGMFKGRSSNSEISSMNHGKIRVLLVEDDTILAMKMVFTLTRAGCDVDAVHTRNRGLELACQREFDLIILDIKLPDADGLELCSELKQRHITRNTPIIFISDSSSSENIAAAKERGGVDYLAKPFDLTELVYKIIYYARARAEQKE
jgi:DNA-binding response OmpR family regulator